MTHKDAVYSESVEDYLKTIVRLGGEQAPVTVNAVAGALNVSPVSAHEMVKRLAEQALVTYQPYKGIALSPEGRDVGSAVQRRHRLWERFLCDVLELPWAQVHDEAGRLEHAASPEVTERLAAFLDNPDSCPHGHPISPAGATPLTEGAACRLSDLGVGQRAAIARVPEDDQRLLDYLDQLGMRPRAVVQIAEIAPFEGPITVSIGGREKPIAPQLARRIIVEISIAAATEE
jgi:DtxR family Mn-dependent transcriptional regulator